MNETLKLGTRRSPLAMWQAEHVKAELQRAHPGLTVELTGIETKGDKILDVALAKVGGKGLFVKELEVALLEGAVDLCVHSTKDMPAELPEGLGLVAFPPRADPRDALAAPATSASSSSAARWLDAREGLAALPHGARVGTSSLRRQAQLKLVRPDLEIVSVRGNIQTRLKKVDELGLSCVVLAAAGLDRMGLDVAVRHRFSPDDMLPAAGQGILAIEARTGDARVLRLLQILDDPASRTAVLAERAFLKALGGGCQVPIGAYATQHGDTLTLRGLVAMPDGSVVVRAVREGAASDPVRLGAQLGEHVLARGGRRILVDLQLADVDGSASGGDRAGTPADGDADPAGPFAGALGAACVVVARDDAPDDRVSLALAAQGAHIVPLRLMRTDEPEDAVPLERAVRGLDGFDAIAFTSTTAVERFFDRLAAADLDLRALRGDALIASVGKATSAALAERHVHVDVEGDAGGLVLAQHLQAALSLAGKRVLLPRAAGGREEFVDAAKELGAEVVVVDAYRQTPGADAAAEVDRALQELSSSPARAKALLLTSPRRVEVLAAVLGDVRRLDGVRTIAIGDTTAAAMKERGLRIDVVVDKPTPAAVAQAVRRFVEV